MDNSWIQQLPYMKLDELLDLRNEVLSVKESGTALGRAKVALIQARIDEYKASELRENAKESYLNAVADAMEDKVWAYRESRSNTSLGRANSMLEEILNNFASYGLSKLESYRIMNRISGYSDTPRNKGEAMAVAPYKAKE